MANFSVDLYKAASGAQWLPIDKRRSDEPFETPVFEDYASRQDITGYMTALWKGAAARDVECLRYLIYLSIKCHEPEDALDLMDMLADTNDAYLEILWKFIHKEIQDAKKWPEEVREDDKKYKAKLALHFDTALCMTDLAYEHICKSYTKDLSPFYRFGEYEPVLLRSYINNVGRPEPEVSVQPSAIRVQPCAPEDKKDYWRSLYRRSDCSSNQIGIYHDAKAYAEKGDPYAMFIVGYLLNRGIRTKYSNPNVTLLEVDHQKALPWLKQAAEAGIVEAYWETACALSEAWYVPETVEDKMEEKLKYIKMGAEKDDPDCLEWLYKYSKDEHEQFKYLVRLADQYKTHAYTLELAKWYEEGKGCKKDEKKAFELAEYVYKHSSISPYDSSYEDAVYLLCRYLRNGIGCEPDPSRAADIRSSYESEEEDMMELLSR